MLAAALTKNTSITKLHFYDNEIGDSEVSALALALPLNTTLIGLDLMNNAIGDSGAVALAKALKGGQSRIKSLNLGHNEIGDSGAAALVEALHDNTGIRRLSSVNNKIGDPWKLALRSTWETRKAPYDDLYL